MDPSPVFRENLELLEAVHIAYLSTVGNDGYPQTRAVFNLRCRHRFPQMTPLLAGHEWDFLLYFTTNTSSPKMEQIESQPKACAYFCRAEDAHGLLLTGRLEVVRDRSIRDACWQEGWERYYPAGREDPEYAILRLRPERMKGWAHGRPFSFVLPERGVV